MGMENYSLADIRAATQDNDGFMGGGNWFWIIVLFLLTGGRGFGFGGLGTDANGALTRAELYDGLNYTQLANGVRDLKDGQCAGFAGVNAGIAENRFSAQQCCCETNRNIDAVRAENYKNTCEITTAIHGEGEATRALINQNTMQNLRDKLADKDRELMTANFQLSQQAQSAALVDVLRPFPTPAYITCSPYQSAYGGCGCGFSC